MMQFHLGWVNTLPLIPLFCRVLNSSLQQLPANPTVVYETSNVNMKERKSHTRLTISKLEHIAQNDCHICELVQYSEISRYANGSLRQFLNMQACNTFKWTKFFFTIKDWMNHSYSICIMECQIPHGLWSPDATRTRHEYGWDMNFTQKMKYRIRYDTTRYIVYFEVFMHRSSRQLKNTHTPKAKAYLYYWRGTIMRLQPTSWCLTLTSYRM